MLETRSYVPIPHVEAKTEDVIPSRDFVGARGT